MKQNENKIDELFELYPCPDCQGGGCPTCQGFGHMAHYYRITSPIIKITPTENISPDKKAPCAYAEALAQA